MFNNLVITFYEALIAEVNKPLLHRALNMTFNIFRRFTRSNDQVIYYTKEAFILTLETPSLLKKFIQFCKTLHNHENIKFLLEVQQLERIYPSIFYIDNAVSRFLSVQSIQSTGIEPEITVSSFDMTIFTEIHDKYFTQGAKNELNIPYNIRRKIAHSIINKTVTPRLFDEAIDHVLQMTYNDSFKKYTKGNDGLKDSDSAFSNSTSGTSILGRKSMSAISAAQAIRDQNRELASISKIKIQRRGSMRDMF